MACFSACITHIIGCFISCIIVSFQVMIASSHAFDHRSYTVMIASTVVACSPTSKRAIPATTCSCQQTVHDKQCFPALLLSQLSSPAQIRLSLAYQGYLQGHSVQRVTLMPSVPATHHICSCQTKYKLPARKQKAFQDANKYFKCMQAK